MRARNLVLELCHLVAAGLRGLLSLGNAGLYCFEVFELELEVDYLLVAHRVNGAVDVCYVIVVEAAEHMQYGIGFADVGQELIAQPLALGSALHQSGDIDNLHRSRHHRLWLTHVDQAREPVVGHGYHAHIRLDGTERKVCRLRLGVRQTVEQGGFAYIRQAHDTAL